MDYALNLRWTGNLGSGTSNYQSYGRSYESRIEGKPMLEGSASSKFRGDETKHDPEDLLMIAVASCHLLSYLALCARAGIAVSLYQDEAKGRMEFDSRGGGRFVEIILHPVVTVTDASRREEAEQLHEKAHALCFIANSCNFPIRNEPVIRVEGGE